MGLCGATSGFGEDRAAAIKEIRTWYARIEADKSLRKRTISTGEDNELQMIELTRYETKDGELKKLHIDEAGEHGERHTTYYFRRGKLFFVYESVRGWTFVCEEDVEGESKARDIVTQCRYYFHGDRCIKALGKILKTKPKANPDKLSKIAELLKDVPNEEIMPGEKVLDFLHEAEVLSAVRTKKQLLDLGY